MRSITALRADGGSIATRTRWAIVPSMRTDSPQRRCDKPNCEEPAAASFSFRYETSEVWVCDLVEPHPSRYDLCTYHVEHLTAPRGWELIDERTASVERLPLAADVAEAWDQVAVGGGSVGSASRGGSDRPGNRYAALSAELPRLAAEVQASEDAGDEGAAGAVDAPITSRGLSPMPADAPGVGGVVLDFDGPRERRDAASADRPASDDDGEAVDDGSDGPDPEGDEPPPDPATG